MGFGYGEEELAELDHSGLAVVQELVAKKMGARGAGQQNQKLVSEADLPRYLAEGWKEVTSLSSNRVVLDPPASAVAESRPALTSGMRPHVPGQNEKAYTNMIG